MSTRKKKPTTPGAPGPIGDVNLAVRQRQALQLLIAGATYQQIADICGISSRGTAYKLCQKALAQWMSPVTDTARALELARLDSYLQMAHKKMTEGNLWALDRCLEIGKRRARLLGLDYGPLAHPLDQQQAQFIMIELPKEVIDAI